jgi:hypothetical protein
MQEWTTENTDSPSPRRDTFEHAHSNPRRARRASHTGAKFQHTCIWRTHSLDVHESGKAGGADRVVQRIQGAGQAATHHVTDGTDGRQTVPAVVHKLARARGTRSGPGTIARGARAVARIAQRGSLCAVAARDAGGAGGRAWKGSGRALLALHAVAELGRRRCGGGRCSRCGKDTSPEVHGKGRLQEGPTQDMQVQNSAAQQQTHNPVTALHDVYSAVS